MDRPSIELLILIFKGLHYKQKAECMLVCTHWASALRGGLDVETIIFLIKPFDILPAANLKTLKIPAPAPAPPFFSNTTVMQYFIKKYSIIEHFYFGANGPFVNETCLHHIEHSLTCVEIGGSCTQLGFADKFASMKLDSLSVNVDLSKLFSRYLLSLNGLRNLETLKLNEVPSLDNCSLFQSFKELKVLELEFKEKKGLKRLIVFNRLISTWLPKKLESLLLCYVQLDYSPDTYGKYTNCNIKQLKLKHTETARNLDTYLNNHFKKLHTLYLHSCKIGHIVRDTKYTYPKNDDIDFFKLPDRRLSRLDIELCSEYKYSTTGYSYIKIIELQGT